jgi:ABC-2 type transport system permease protein
MLKGANLGEVSFEVGILGVFILAFAGTALLRFRRTLD